MGMNNKLQISMLGPFTVRVGNRSIAFRTDAERALLAYLAAHQGVPQRRDTLAALLSPDRPDQEALTYLRNRLTRLRSALGDAAMNVPWLESDRKQITLRTGNDVVIDVIHFEQLLATVEAHPHRQLAGCLTCLAHLQAAVELVRGEFVAGLNFPSDVWEAWLVAQREHLQQRVLGAMAQLRIARLALGEWEAALAVAGKELALEPWLEAAHRALMMAHYQLGDRNAALAQYEQCVSVLWDELGVEPEDETQQLQQQILDSEMVVRVGRAIPDNLPMYTGHFFGREAEKHSLLQQLADPNVRLVTLVGIGGIGKTRLSVEVGQAIKTNFPDGVWFVPLDAVGGSAEQIKIAVGEVVGNEGTVEGLARASKQLTGDQVLAILREKRMLLILDNCEVVLGELGFIAEWLKRAPQLVILATSREPLNFVAESVVTLGGLPTGEAKSVRGVVADEIGAAEALFAERGQMALAGFGVQRENVLSVRQICQLVDGLPLGIALAAAWVRRRSLPQIIQSIEESLDFLRTHLRDVDPRHQSIQAVFETSWQLLEPAEQAALAALSVFPTSFSVASANAVATASLSQLDLLCEKSLLQQHHAEERYALHSLLRQFAAGKLANYTGEIQRLFVAHYYAFARDHQADYAKLQPEWPNILAAITRAHALADWQTVINFVQVLDEAWFRQIRFNDMRKGLTLALDAATALDDQEARLRILLRLGEVEMELNDYDAAEAHLCDALAGLMQVEDSLGTAQAKFLMGRIKTEQAQNDQALALFEESRWIFEQEANWVGVGKNLNFIAVCTIKRHRDFQTAQAHLEESAALQRRLPFTPIYIETLRYLARTQNMMQAYADGEKTLVEAARVSQQLNDLGEYAAVLYERVFLCKIREQFDEALAFGYECLENFKKLGSLRWEGLVKTQLGLLHQAKAEHTQAEALLTEALQIFDEVADLYEQAYAYYYLYKLHTLTDATEKGVEARMNALRLNVEIQDPQLTERLG